MTEKKLYIIRHGETDLNKQGIVQGRGINTDLNSTGKNQSMAFFEMYKGVHFDKIYVSSLKRTHQTIDPFIKELNTPFEILPELDEISWGLWEGRPMTDEVKKEMETVIEQWSNGHTDYAPKEGESPVAVLERLKKAFNYILNKKEEKNVLICTHGRTLRILMCWITATPLNDMDVFKHLNTSLYVIKYVDNKFELEKTFDIEHLKDLKE